MNSQFKKGVLELIVLVSVNKRDMYGYELVLEVSKVVDVNEGTIYPLLKRLKELKEGWKEFSDSVNNFIKESDKNE